MNFKLTFTSNEDIMEKYGSTQGRSISTNKIVEFIKPLISIDLPNMAAQMRFCLESGEGFKIFPQKISVQGNSPKVYTIKTTRSLYVFEEL